jgi:hypothetical protein
MHLKQCRQALNIPLFFGRTHWIRFYHICDDEYIVIYIGIRLLGGRDAWRDRSLLDEFAYLVSYSDTWPKSGRFGYLLQRTWHTREGQKANNVLTLIKPFPSLRIFMYI